MNKSEKLMMVLLGLLLAGYVWHSFNQSKKDAEAQAKYQQELAAWEAAHPEEAARERGLAEGSGAGAVQTAVASAEAQAVPAAPPKPRLPEQFVSLTNDQVGARAEFVFSTRGAALKAVTLFEFSEKPGLQGEDNPPFRLDFSASPALELSGVPGLDADADWTVQARSADSVTFAAGPVVRTITLKDNYQIEVKETFQGVPESTPTRLSLGIMSRSAVRRSLD